MRIPVSHPTCVPLRETLMAMTGRPVNIQASRDVVLKVRGDLLDQPYLTLDRSTSDASTPLLQHPLRRHRARGGARSGDPGAAPDLVVLQEASKPAVVEQLARDTGLTPWGARPGHSLGFLSRIPVDAAWHRPRVSRHAFLEITPAGTPWRVFGVHLSAVHAAWTERRRVYELRALLAAIGREQPGPTRSSAISTRWRPANCSTRASCRRGCVRWCG